jgi:hypothetical protein
VQDKSTEIAWAAGLFEGEGSIAFTTKTGVQLVLCMCDLDVVERFAGVVGCGAIYSYPARNNEHSDPHRWVVSNKPDVERTLRALLPWFGSRRLERARLALERLALNPGSRRNRKHCPHGHEYNVSNTVMDGGKRKCRICLTARREARNEARRSAISPA